MVLKTVATGSAEPWQTTILVHQGRSSRCRAFSCEVVIASIPGDTRRIVDATVCVMQTRAFCHHDVRQDGEAACFVI